MNPMNRRGWQGWTSALWLMTMLSSGCLDDGGGSESLQAAAVLRGFVTEFEAAGQVFTGGVAGVEVSVVGTDLKATTADDGLFVIFGAPPGERVLQLAFLDTVARLAVTVPEDAVVDLNQVRVRQGQVQVSAMNVTLRSPDGSGGGSPGPSPGSSPGAGPMGGEPSPGPGPGPS